MTSEFPAGQSDTTGTFLNAASTSARDIQQRPVILDPEIREDFIAFLKRRMARQMGMRKPRNECIFTIGKNGIIEASTAYGNALIGASMHALYTSTPKGDEKQILIRQDELTALRNAVAIDFITEHGFQIIDNRPKPAVSQIIEATSAPAEQLSIKAIAGPSGPAQAAAMGG